MRIAVGSDHRGYQIKLKVLELVQRLGHEAIDAGPPSEASVDYPDIAAIVAQKVSRGEVDRGILICGTGIGMCIAANKLSRRARGPLPRRPDGRNEPASQRSQRPLPVGRHVGRKTDRSDDRHLVENRIRRRTPRPAGRKNLGPRVGLGGVKSARRTRAPGPNSLGGARRSQSPWSSVEDRSRRDPMPPPLLPWMRARAAHRQHLEPFGRPGHGRFLPRGQQGTGHAQAQADHAVPVGRPGGRAVRRRLLDGGLPAAGESQRALARVLEQAARHVFVRLSRRPRRSAAVVRAAGGGVRLRLAAAVLHHRPAARSPGRQGRSGQQVSRRPGCEQVADYPVAAWITYSASGHLLNLSLLSSRPSPAAGWVSWRR